MSGLLFILKVRGMFFFLDEELKRGNLASKTHKATWKIFIDGGQCNCQPRQ